MNILYNGNVILTIQPTDESYRYRAVKGEHSLTLYYSLPEHVELPIGAYVNYEGLTYTLIDAENLKKNGSRNFEYTLVLYAPQANLQKYKIKDISGRLKFSYTAKPQEHLQLIVDNLNARESGWTVGTYVDSSEKVIGYNHQNLYDALNTIADEFKTEWEINGKEISLRKVEYNKSDPLALSYGMGNGFVAGVGRTIESKGVDILHVQGGSRNIDASKYGSNDLLLPKSQTLTFNGRLYQSDANGLSIQRSDRALTSKTEDSLDLSNIYPSRVGAVSQVTVIDAAKSFYDIVDSSIPDSLNYEDCLMEGEKMTIIFETGMLTGKEFEVKYIHANKRFEIVPQEIDGQTMPSGVFVPVIGDKYAVFGIQLPQSYISDNATKTGASWDMFREAAKYLSENEDDKITFTGELDGILSKQNWLTIGGKIKVGGYISFSDADFLPVGNLIRIVGVKDYVNNPYSPVLELSNSTGGRTLSSELKKIGANEVLAGEMYKDIIRFTKRRFRDSEETIKALEDAMIEGFGDSISPITVRTMALLIGDESLQFRFVNSTTNPTQIPVSITYSSATKVLSCASAILQHMTIGINEIKPIHAATDYKYWNLSAYTSPPISETTKKYYLYARVSKTAATGEYVLSETAIDMESVAGYYYLLIGILNSEFEGTRSFVSLYGFTEVLPARITTDRIVSSDGSTYFDLANGIIGGRLKFIGSGGVAKDVANEVSSAQASAANAQTAANTAQTSANNAQTTATAAQTKIDNLKIGVSNLVHKSRLVWGFLNENDGSNIIGYSTYMTDPNFYACAGNEDYVYTIYAWQSGYERSWVHWYDANKVGIGKSLQVFNSGAWLFKSPANAAFYRVTIGHPDLKCKLEKGNVSTDWSESDIDITARTAKLVSLSGATQIITVSKTGVVTPSTTFAVTATAQNTTITAWTYSIDGGGWTATLPQGVTRSNNVVSINPTSITFKTLSIKASDGSLEDTFTVARAIDGLDGTDGKGIAIKGTVAAYSNLPASGNIAGDAYLVQADGKLYIWDGTKFPANGSGVVFKGDKGDAGVDGYTVLLSNESHTFAGSESAAIAASTFSDVLVYKGANAINATLSVGALPTGLSASVSGNRVTFTASASLVSSGIVDITIVADGKTFVRSFSFAISYKGATGKSVSKVDVEFSKTASATVAPTTGWQTTAPAWQQGYYIWSRQVTTYTDSTTTTSVAVNLTGATGSGGATGTGVTSITEEYYLSTSKTTQTGGTWVTTPPTWAYGLYIWTRVKIVYSNPTSTSYTEPIVSSEWEAVNSIKIGGANLINKTRLTAGFWHESNGVSKVVYSNYHCDDTFYPCVAGEQFMLTTFNPQPLGTEGNYLSWYDASNNYLGKTNTEYNTFSVLLTAPVNAAFYRITIGHKDLKIKLERGNKATDWSESDIDRQAAIAAAQTAANNAQTATNNLNTYVDGAFKDGVIEAAEAKAIEKYINVVNETVEQVNTAYNVVYNDPLLVGSFKSNLESAKTNLDTSKSSLIDAINTAIADGKTTLAEKATVDNAYTDFKNKIGIYATAQEAAYKSITDGINSKANTAQSAADAAQATATNAANAANTAQANANTANAILADLSSDSKLTAVEKQQTQVEWTVILNEKTNIESQASAFGVSSTNYTTAYNSLSTYITPLLSNLTATSDISGTTFRTNFNDYYQARTTLLNAIAAKAKQLADAAQTTANEIKVGGQNLIRQSNVIRTGSSGWLPIFSLEDIPFNEQMVLTIWTGDGVENSVGIGFSTNGAWSGSFFDNTILSPNSTYRKVFVLNKSNYNEIAIYVNASTTILKIKLERGNRGSDWTAAESDKKEGGRNLVRLSDEAVSNTLYPTKIYNLVKPMSASKVYTFSIKGVNNSSSTGKWMLYLSGGQIQVAKIKKDNAGVTSISFIGVSSGLAADTLHIYSESHNSSLTNTIEWVKLEEGSNATGWSAAPEDLEDYVQSFEDAVNAVSEKTNNMILFDGGVALANVLMVGDGVNIGGGLSGVNASNGNEIWLWGGASFSNRNTAPFRVDRSGKVWAANAVISGVINATSGVFNNVDIQTGNIGGFTLSGSKLRALKPATGTNDAALLFENLEGGSFIRFNEHLNAPLASIRTDIPSRMAMQIQTYGVGATGLQITSNSIDASSYAIKSYGSHTFGMRMGERWNAPGVLVYARVFFSGNNTPTINEQWAISTITLSISNYDAGAQAFDLNHNIGHTDYIATVIPTYEQSGKVELITKYENRVRIDIDFSLIAFFDIMIIGRNKL